MYIRNTEKAGVCLYAIKVMRGLMESATNPIICGAIRGNYRQIEGALTEKRKLPDKYLHIKDEAINALNELRAKFKPSAPPGQGGELAGPSRQGPGPGPVFRSLLFPLFIAGTLFAGMGASGSQGSANSVVDLVLSIAKAHPEIVVAAGIIAIALYVATVSDLSAPRSSAEKSRATQRVKRNPEPGTLRTKDKSAESSILAVIAVILYVSGIWICCNYGYTGLAGPILTPWAISMHDAAYPVIFALVLLVLTKRFLPFLRFSRRTIALISLAACVSLKILLSRAAKYNDHTGIFSAIGGHVFSYHDIAAYVIGALVVYMVYPERGRSSRAARTPLFSGLIAPFFIIAAAAAGLYILINGVGPGVLFNKLLEMLSALIGMAGFGAAIVISRKGAAFTITLPLAGQAPELKMEKSPAAVRRAPEPERVGAKSFPTSKLMEDEVPDGTQGETAALESGRKLSEEQASAAGPKKCVIAINPAAAREMEGVIRDSLRGVVDDPVITRDSSRVDELLRSGAYGIVLDMIKAPDASEAGEIRDYVRAIRAIAEDKDGSILRRVLDEIKKELCPAGRFDIDSAVAELMKDAGRARSARSRLRGAIAAQKEKTAAAYNNYATPEIPAGAAAAVATTDTALENDMFFFDNAARASKLGVLSPVIFGGVFKDEARARAYVGEGFRACGLSGGELEEALRHVVFIDKYDARGGVRTRRALEDAIRDGISRSRGIDVAAGRIAIRSIKGEIRADAAAQTAVDSKLLEIEESVVNGRRFPVMANTYRFALGIATMTIDGNLPPGMTRDEKGRYLYCPPMVPLGWAEEIAAYRDAMKLLTTAA
jgi:hypothetical protein